MKRIDRECLNKVRHETQESAEEVARKRYEERKCYIPLRAYKCRFCSNWHLTSKPLAP